MSRIRLILCALAAALLLGACAAVPEPAQLPTETAAPTEVLVPETEAPTEPQPEHFVLTFVGDCTLGCTIPVSRTDFGFIKTVGDDYGWPFRNVIEYFENDDFTMINLEGALCDEGNPVPKEFNFRGPTSYTQLLTDNSVEAVTLANNHSMDFGKQGYESTVAALEGAGVSYVEANSSAIFTTESGLTIGLYAVTYGNLDQEAICEGIAQLRANEDVDVVVFAAHWGIEMTYRPNDRQIQLGHAAIDAGADIVYGSHPHVLQPIEEYNGGIIYYSLGNFSFGGHGNPPDYDTVVLQQEIIRNPDGTISLGARTIIPCSVSSITGRNNYQPTPYAEGTEEYDRTMSKLDGTFAVPYLPRE